MASSELHVDTARINLLPLQLLFILLIILFTQLLVETRTDHYISSDQHFKH